jgi:hypothetical protein
VRTVTYAPLVCADNEFFAPGMAYVALSRARRLDQLHLWGLDLSAIHADPGIEHEYAKLISRRLTSEIVSSMPFRAPVALPPLALVPVQHLTTFVANGAR